MKPLEVWTCQTAENLKKKSSKIPKNNYPATMVSAARRQIIGGGGGGAPINKSRRRRRPQIVGDGGAARPAHGSKAQYYFPNLNVSGNNWVREQLCHQLDFFYLQTAKKLQLTDCAACRKLRFKLAETN